MFDALPLTFSAQAEIVNDIKNAKPLFEQIEAWLNFETLKANWFGREEKVLSCVFLLLNEQSFHQTQQQILSLDEKDSAAWHLEEIERYLLKQTSGSNKVKVVFTISNAILEKAKDDNSNEPIEKALKNLLTEIVNIIATNNRLDKIS